MIYYLQITIFWSKNKLIVKVILNIRFAGLLPGTKDLHTNKKFIIYEQAFEHLLIGGKPLAKSNNPDM